MAILLKCKAQSWSKSFKLIIIVGDTCVFKTWQINQSDPISVVVRLIFVCKLIPKPMKVTPTAEVSLMGFF